MNQLKPNKNFAILAPDFKQLNLGILFALCFSRGPPRTLSCSVSLQDTDYQRNFLLMFISNPLAYATTVTPIIAEALLLHRKWNRSPHWLSPNPLLPAT